MLSSVFLGNDVSLKSYQMQFLPMERVSWERLQVRGFFTATSRHDGPTLRLIPPPHTSRRRLGDHPLMFELTRGVTTRDLVKALLLLLFPLSYMECRRRTGTVTSGDSGVTSQNSRSGRVEGSSTRSHSIREPITAAPRPPPAAAIAPSGLRSFRKSVGPTTPRSRMSKKDDRIARALRSADAAVARISLNDVVPLDEVDGVLSLDVPQFLCYIFLPMNYVLQHPDGDADLDQLPTETALEVFRASRSLCAWARWVLQRQKTTGGVIVFEDIETHFASHVVDRDHLAAPLMFPTPTREKALRFMDLRSLGPQSIVAFMHMLSVFLTDTFELAFTKAAVSRLRAAVTSADASEFLHTLDMWRFEDGWEHVKQLLAAYPTQEALTHATAEGIVTVSKLMLPTPAHRVHLQRSVEAMPRRTIAATSYVLLNASVPLGSVAQEQRAARQRDKASGDDDDLNASHGLAHVKYGLFPTQIPSDRFDSVLMELFSHTPSTSASPPTCVDAAVDVWSRMDDSAARDFHAPTLEEILIERMMASAANIGVAQTLVGSVVAHKATQRRQQLTWTSERSNTFDMRPVAVDRCLSARPADGHAASFAQATRSARAHVYDRNIRALERAKRKQAPTLPHLAVPLPNEDDWQEHKSRLPPDEVVTCATSKAATPAPPSNDPPHKAQRASRWQLDPETELTTALPPPMEGLSRMQIFEFFHNGPASLRQPTTPNSSFR
ncbi:Hypothetical protein, putative [Bodo saltans]|uniref:Uncharacterized protein n=1 Tax=Bodo saltans TaxID=75058 RepID=A0A0S4JGM1_BODSA|nr:Hypothetical protein, putative [Bodo saltans]|eukprot:CUG89289.1 Hypothetical protein, putative [Bodo saltans]